MGKRKEQLYRRDRPTIRAAAAAGLSRRAIASKIRMIYGDFLKSLKRDPVAQLALEAGEAEHEMRLYNQLLAVADRYEGKTGSVTPLLFALKSRAGYNDRPPPEPQQTVNNVQILLPAPLSEAQARRRLEAQTETKAIEGEVLSDDDD